MSLTTFKAIVNEEQELQLDAEQMQALDFLALHNGDFHILADQKAYRAEVLSANCNTKTFQIKINGNTYNVELKDQYDQLVEQLGLSVVDQQIINDIAAPMPGLVLDIPIAVGDKVVKGDALLILEAMKMENVIKSPGEGVVKSIEVSKGATVDKGALMIVLE